MALPEMLPDNIIACVIKPDGRIIYCYTWDEVKKNIDAPQGEFIISLPEQATEVTNGNT